MLLKLDLSKAYDKLIWQFLAGILKAFGFVEEWSNWITNMVSSAFFSILVNGSPSNPFNMTRGIRQGDPLSPFLFIIMGEGLIRLIQDQNSRGEVRGLNIQMGMEKKTHEQFIDNTTLMGHPSFQEARAFKISTTLFLKE